MALIVTTSADHTARLWNAATGEPMSRPLEHGGWVHYASFSSDGRLLATASADGTARIWDASTGEACGPPLKHSTVVGRVFFSPDGRWLVTTTSDGGVHFWKLPREIRPLEDDLLLARLLAKREVAEAGTLAVLPRTTLETDFHTLRAKYPARLMRVPK